MDKIKRQILKISGERIRRARLLKGFSQKELAAMCGYSDSTTIYKIEKGLQDIPTSKIKLLCKALDIDFDYLKGDIDYMIDFNGEAVMVERHTIDSQRDELKRQLEELLFRANTKQLKQIIDIVTVIIGGEDNGASDME